MTYDHVAKTPRRAEADRARITGDLGELFVERAAHRRRGEEQRFDEARFGGRIREVGQVVRSGQRSYEGAQGRRVEPGARDRGHGIVQLARTVGEVPGEDRGEQVGVGRVGAHAGDRGARS